jgi:hypothetical protein
MSRVENLRTIQKLLRWALEQTEALQEKQDEIENPTHASERTAEACDEIAHYIGEAITAIDDVVEDLTP